MTKVQLLLIFFMILISTGKK